MTALSRRDFLWRTMDGKVLTLAEMDTKHIFNSMKMVFNHLAEEFSANPVWFTKRYADYRISARYDSNGLACQVLMFIAEIERRGDLPRRYSEPYEEITRQVFEEMKLKKLTPGVRLLSEGRS